MQCCTTEEYCRTTILCHSSITIIIVGIHETMCSHNYDIKGITLFMLLIGRGSTIEIEGQPAPSCIILSYYASVGARDASICTCR